jgi:hypothetical protein
MSNYNLLGVLTATAVSLGVAFAGAASAATVAFTSTSTWSAGAGGSGCSTGCDIDNNFGATATSTYRIGNNPNSSNDSILSTTNFSTSFATDATAVTLGAITWRNAATTDTDTNFNVLYNLTINFSLPSDLAADTTTFTLNVQQPTNPPGDSISNTNVAIPNVGPFALAGVTVSNIRWVLVAPSGGSTFNSATGQWFNPEGNTATLRLVADFTATPVPEPASP